MSEPLAEDERAELQRLRDERAIRDVLERYTAAIDEHDWGLLITDVFTADATLDYTSSGGPRGEVDEVVAWIRTALEAIPVALHWLADVRVSLSGDRATSTAAFVNPLRFEGDTPVLVIGRYLDELVRTDAGWRIRVRTERMDWTMPHLGGGG